jgi:uncharacterized membrane protein YhhN
MQNFQLLVAASIFASGIYFVRTFVGERRLFDPWLKASGVALLAFATVFSPAIDPSTTLLLTIALILSAVGDLLLGFRDPVWFKRGLVAFLLAHLLYSLLFISLAPDAWWFRTDIWLVVIILSFSAFVLLSRLWRGLGKMRGPVILYCLATMAMVVCATATGNRWLLTAALLFAFSDTLIAVREFHRPYQFSGPAIWLTYYLAQLMIFLLIV